MNQTVNYQGPIIFFAFMLGLSFLIGGSVTVLPLNIPLIAVAGLFLFFFGFAFSHIALVILIYAMLLSPEYVIGTAARRNIVIRIDDLLIVVFSLAWIARMVILRSKVVTKTALNRPILIYCALFTLATLRGMISGNVLPLQGSFYILKYIEYILIYFVVTGIIRDKNQIKSFLKAFCFTFFIVNVYAISQIGLVSRVSAPFEGTPGEPNTLGGYIVLIQAVLLGIITQDGFGRKQWIAVGLCFLSFVPLAFSLSRSSYLAYVVMYVTLIVLSSTKKKNMLMGAMIVAVILSIFFFPQNVKDRIVDTFTPHATQYTQPETILGITVGPSASERIQSWKIMFERWKESPFLGYGVTGQGFIDSQYSRTLVELGAIGFAAFIYLLYSIYRHALFIYRRAKDPLLKGLALGFLAGHIGMICHALTANTYILIRVMEPYWFLAGIVMMIPTIEKKMQAQEEEQEQEPSPALNKKAMLNSRFLLRNGQERASR